MDGWPTTTLLGRLPEPAGKALALAGLDRRYPAGRTLMAQGDSGDYLLLLLSGTVKVTVNSEDGQNTLLSVRVGGETVGEMAALERVPRMATVKSCRTVEAKRIDHGELTRLMAEHPVIAVQLARMMSARLRWSDDRRIDIGSCRARQRLCRILVDLAHREENGSRLMIDHLTQHEIGSLVGIRKRSAEAHFIRLQAEGLIYCHYRAVEVIDMPGLQDIAAGR